MALDSYSNLKTAVADWLARSDLTSVIDDFIDLAETDINRDLRVAEMITALSDTTSSGVLSVPTGFLEWRHVYVDGSPARNLRPTTPDSILRDYPTRSATGKPIYIAREGSNFVFGPYPDTDYTIAGSYYAKLTPLGDGTGGTATTNYLTDEAPDLILAGALAHAHRYLMDEQRAQYWSAAYLAALNSSQQRDENGRLSRSTPLRVVPR